MLKGRRTFLSLVWTLKICENSSPPPPHERLGGVFWLLQTVEFWKVRKLSDSRGEIEYDIELTQDAGGFRNFPHAGSSEEFDVCEWPGFISKLGPMHSFLFPIITLREIQGRRWWVGPPLSKGRFQSETGRGGNCHQHSP